MSFEEFMGLSSGGDEDLVTETPVLAPLLASARRRGPGTAAVAGFASDAGTPSRGTSGSGEWSRPVASASGDGVGSGEFGGWDVDESGGLHTPGHGSGGSLYLLESIVSAAEFAVPGTLPEPAGPRDLEESRLLSPEVRDKSQSKALCCKQTL